MIDAMKKYQEKIEEKRQENERENQKAWTEFSENMSKDKLSKKEVAEEVRKLKGKVRKQPKSFKDWKPHRMSTARMNRFFGFFTRSTNTSGTYLAFDDPRMVASRLAHAEAVRSNNVDPRLILKLGQVNYVIYRGLR